MGIIRKKTATPKRYIGVKAELYIFEYLTLYAIVKRTNKSKLYYKMVETWVTEKKKEYPDDLLLESFIDRMNTERKIEKENKVDTPEDFLSINDFKQELQDDLMKEGLKPAYITIILSRITV